MSPVQDKDILAFQVSVYDALVVQIRQAGSDALSLTKKSSVKSDERPALEGATGPS